MRKLVIEKNKGKSICSSLSSENVAGPTGAIHRRERINQK
jgi:hypothetical protein